MNDFHGIIHLQRKTDQANCFSTTSTTTAPKIRKLAIHLNRDVKRVVLPELETTKQLRSILFYNPRHDNESSIELKSHFKYFKLLRNLDLEGFKFDEKSVKSIGNLISLRNKFKLDGLSKLKTFEGFNIWNCDVNDLFKINNLRQLEATFSETDNSQDFVAFINYLNIGDDYLNIIANDLRRTSLSVYFSFEEEKLTILKHMLRCNHLYKLSIFGFIPKLPQYQVFSRSIINLQLCSCKLQEDPMPTLERLLRLQFLNLDSDAFVGDKMVCSANGFRQLKTVQLHCLMHFKE
ncbi:hypothetical protein ACSBR1_042429 [Camellia fascicularis]